MKNLLLQFVFIFALFGIAFGQVEEPKPMLVDEFGNLHLDDMISRLDALIVETQNAPNSKALVRVFGTGLEGKANHYSRADIIEAYMINMRRFSSDKLVIETCFEESGLRTMLFVLPQDAVGDKDYVDKLETPKKKILFSGVSFVFGGTKLSPYKEISIEYEPTIGNYSKRTFQKVKKLLDQSNEHKVYVIAYLGTNLQIECGEDENGQKTSVDVRFPDKKSIAKKLLKNATNELAKYKINSSQIKTIDGGYVDTKRGLEFWFSPKDGEIPKPKPNYFPNKKE